MCRYSGKLLAVALAILLGLIPQQGAMAGVAGYFQQNSSVYQQIDMHHGADKLTAGHSAGTCDQCGDEGACTDHTCSTNLCTSCPVALLPNFLFTTKLIVSSASLPSDDYLVKRHSYSLFRPPKA